MKYFTDFLAELKKGVVFPVYLFYGPENYLKDQAVLRLKENLLPTGGEQFNCQVVDGEKAEVQELLAIPSCAPLLPGRQLVVVHNPSFFKPASKKQATEKKLEQEKVQRLKVDEQLFLDYLASPVDNTSLVLVAGPSVDRRKKVYKETARLGRAVEFARLRPGDLIKWLAKRAHEEKCFLGREAAQIILERCGRDMYTLGQEINKLVCFVGQGQEISPTVVRELVTGSVEENIFEVVDAIGVKDCQRALLGIRNLLLQKYPPQQILGMVARQFRLILQVLGLREAGQTRHQMVAALKLHPFVYKKISQQCHNFSTNQLVKYMHELVELDYRVKSGGAVFYPAMETFILKICAEKQ